MVADIFLSWTLPAILTALASGIGLGVILASIIPDIKRVAFILFFTAALWYVPQTLRLSFVPETASPIRQFGVMGLYLIWYVFPALLIACWRERRQPE